MTDLRCEGNDRRPGRRRNQMRCVKEVRHEFRREHQSGGGTRMHDGGGGEVPLHVIRGHGRARRTFKDTSDSKEAADSALMK